MTQLIPHSEYRPFSFNRGGDERRGQARRALAVQASSLRSFDPVAQYGLPLWASPGMHPMARDPTDRSGDQAMARARPLTAPIARAQRSHA